MRSLRRGSGSDVAGSRPYRPGDDMDTIDWAASARLSTARGTRRVRRPRALRGGGAEGRDRLRPPAGDGAASAPPLPWLDKPRAMRTVVELDPRERRRRGRLRRLSRLRGRRPALAAAEGRAEADRAARRAALVVGVRRAAGLARALDRPSRRRTPARSRRAPSSSSSRTSSPRRRATTWLTALEHRWDIVPVVIQDPTWEQSFPDVNGIVVPLRDPGGGRCPSG